MGTQATIDTRIAQRHAVSDDATGIGIVEDGEQVIITGLELPPHLLESLQTIAGIWKYGLHEVTDTDA